MFYLIHMALGLLIGGYFHSAPLVIIVALLSHFILDMLPHWDGPYDKAFFEKTGQLKAHKAMYFIEAFDFILAALLAVYFISSSGLLNGKMMALGVMCSMAPDVLKLGYFTPLKNKKFYSKYLQFHSRIQNEVGWKSGIFYQVIVFISLLVIFHFV